MKFHNPFSSGQSSSQKLSPPLEQNLQQIETTQVTPPSMNHSDSNTETRSNLDKNFMDKSIPTSFKKFLFWPTPKENIAKRKLIKDKVPAVATSCQWQQYYKKQEEKKKQEEQLKMQRKEKRI
ncbi:unnamed protein product [Diabrotica balteata]|uniref:Uncharacterized protein n=1 Tax=Diabrotica balteata TaxID=107213 RepID=A0A9N9X7T6_DIABA|nr:unnamed protein product [Diabrotica balteata]